MKRTRSGSAARPQKDSVRKLISFDDETYQALVQLSRDRMGTLQDMADEAFRDLLKKHGVPVSLKDALKRSLKASRHHMTKADAATSSSTAVKGARRRA